MAANVLLVFILIVGVIALATLLLYTWMKDPFKTSLGSCMSSLAILIGGLGIPEISGRLDLALDLGFVSLHSVDTAFATGTPTAMWVTAFISIVLLVALFAVLIFLKQRPAVGGNPLGLGGPVY